MHTNSITIMLGEREYHLKPTFEAAAAIESTMGKSITQVSGDVLSMSVTAIYAVLRGALLGNGHDVDEGALKAAVLASLRTEEVELLSNAITFISAFFPQVEGDGSKKQIAQAAIG